MVKRIPTKIIHYVERTEKKKFRKVPVLKGTVGYGGYNEVDVTVEGKKVVEVHNAHVSLSSHLNTKKGKDWGRVVLVHELRENLNSQYKHTAERNRHRMALRHQTQDIKWLKRNKYLSQGRTSFGADVKSGKGRSIKV